MKCCIETESIDVAGEQRWTSYFIDGKKNLNLHVPGALEPYCKKERTLRRDP
jgi:hypothetical protein